MSDPEVIPKPIFEAIKAWRGKCRLDKRPCQVLLHMNSEGDIVFADRLEKRRVAGDGTHLDGILIP